MSILTDEMPARMVLRTSGTGPWCQYGSHTPRASRARLATTWGDSRMAGFSLATCRFAFFDPDLEASASPSPSSSSPSSSPAGTTRIGVGTGSGMGFTDDCFWMLS